MLLGILGPEDGNNSSSEKLVHFKLVKGVTSQKIVIFITATVRTSNPTRREMHTVSRWKSQKERAS
jgi:hypothetical protein